MTTVMLTMMIAIFVIFLMSSRNLLADHDVLMKMLQIICENTAQEIYVKLLIKKHIFTF